MSAGAVGQPVGPLAGWVAGDLTRLVGADFAVAQEAQRPPLRLVEVHDAAGAGGDRPTRSFSLIFHSPDPVPFRQGVRRLRHPDGSAVDVFLVPIGPDAEGQGYQAVFG